MSQLIDSIERRLKEDPQAEISGRWYIAKPLIEFTFRHRIRNAWRVLRGKAFAVHYAQDSTETYWR